MASTSSSLLSVENIPQDVMRRLSRDIVELVNEPLEGICVLVNDADLTDIQAIIDGPDDTPYAGGKFRVKLVLPKDFPASPPRGFFLTRVFHPNVAQPSGEICVNTLKRDWNSSLGIRHILLTVKCLLITPNPESALNEEAGKLLLEDYAAYANRARMITEIHARPSSHAPAPAASDCANVAPKRRAVDDEQVSAGVTKKPSVSKAAATKKLLRRL